MTSQTDADCLIILLTFLVKVYENYGLDAAGAYNYEYRRTVETLYIMYVLCIML